MLKETQPYNHLPRYSMHHPMHQSYYSMHPMDHTLPFTHGAPGIAAVFMGLMFLLLIAFCLSAAAQHIRKTRPSIGSSLLRQVGPQIHTDPHAYQQGYQEVSKKRRDAPGYDYSAEWQQYEAPQASYPEMPRQRS